MPKVDFTIIVYNGEPFVELNLKNIYDFANKIIIIEGPVKHYQKLGFNSSTDNTVDVIKNFPDPDNKIILESGQWNGKDHMIKAQEKYFNGDYVWEVDVDEFYKKQDMKKIFDYLDNNECYSMGFRLFSFYGGFNRYITNWEEKFEVQRIKKIIPGQSKWKTHRPPTMIWPKTGKTCKEMGHVSFDTTDSWGIRIYHYSHIFPKQVKAKMAYYYNRDPRGIIADYWNKLYVPWMRAKDSDKLDIEKPTMGVQENTPKVRGAAFTALFNGTHPSIIQDVIGDMETRIRQEGIELGIWEK